MRPDEQVVTVITKHGRPQSALVQQMKANGAEVWSDVHIRASYAVVKKTLPNSKFKDMRSMYGRHKGETVFICGAGPSLTSCPSTLPGPVFAINRAIKHVKADYWCFSDVKATRDSGDHQNAKTAEWAFGSALHCFFKDSPGYLIEAIGAPLDVKDESQRPLYWNGATFSWVLHWAVKSGAKRIVIMGCEFSLSGYYDGSRILPFDSRKKDGPDLGELIVCETARLRIDDMFGEDRPQWFDPNVELLDASNGYLPIPKTRLEDWL